MSDLSFFCVGSPAPGGSKNAFQMYKDGKLFLKNGRPVILISDAGGESNKRWKAAVKIQAKSFMQGAKPFTCPLKVEFIFFLQRPLKHFVAAKRDRPLRPDAPALHIQMPDALKYARSTEDAMTGVVWVDDSQNVRLCTEKRWCGPGDKEGCAVRIMRLPDNGVPDNERVKQPELL